VHGNIKVNTIFFDSTINDELRRQHLYNGQLFVLPCPRSLCVRVRPRVIEEAAPLDPRDAVQPTGGRYAAILAIKPHFIHHQVKSSLFRESSVNLGVT